jgi:DNA topoisomerase-1
MIDDFYSRFHPQVEDTAQNTAKFKGERYLGNDPKSERNVYVKIGKYGAFAQIGDREESDKPKFAKLRDGQFIENITLEEALELFKLPRELGEYEEKPVQVSIGRFGPYVKHDNKFYSLPKEDDPYTVQFDRAIEVIQEKREAERKRTILSFDHNGSTLKVLRGRFGPYISYDKKNFKIPKDKDAENLSEEECIEIVSNPENQSGKGKQKKGGSGKKVANKSSGSKTTKTTANKKTSSKKQ